MRGIIHFIAGVVVTLAALIGFEALLAKLGVGGSVGEIIVMITFAALFTAWWWDYGRRPKKEESDS